ncbi:MAG: hypothetical protein BWY74_03233 [Firmicutes bacterium ADurb.Bin419]|nr:MAG: hypothetical protein BWY74_03233 [Firmicutes bacterium ADurb.Bin419]
MGKDVISNITIINLKIAYTMVKPFIAFHRIAILANAIPTKGEIDHPTGLDTINNNKAMAKIIIAAKHMESKNLPIMSF